MLMINFGDVEIIERRVWFSNSRTAICHPNVKSVVEDREYRKSVSLALRSRLVQLAVVLKDNFAHEEQ